ncbi:DUF3892 domain-containing protein [Geomicrobium sp. JSM 1781026]|uniref:DUF3892 domain-containing protein n=1 Tax=Geomicrobium sp. JSM 1781026 TaxID=3344580 RepID=UPI0035C26B63
MPQEITHIRVSDENAQSTERIVQVRLRNSEEPTTEKVVHDIRNENDSYFYTTSSSTKAEVEAVPSSTGRYYIRTKKNETTKDNLLMLPKF